MPLWEGILASFCAGVGVSLINRFGLSQIKTPCEKRQELAARDTCSDSSSDEGSHVGATSAAIVDIHLVHSHGD